MFGKLLQQGSENNKQRTNITIAGDEGKPVVLEDVNEFILFTRTKGTFRSNVACSEIFIQMSQIVLDRIKDKYAVEEFLNSISGKER